MMEATQPRYEWGQRVVAAQDLFNDGTYPDQPLDALLVRGGDAGEIVQVGSHVDSGTVVYMVEFAAERVIGCFEPELMRCEPKGGSL